MGLPNDRVSDLYPCAVVCEGFQVVQLNIESPEKPVLDVGDPPGQSGVGMVEDEVGVHGESAHVHGEAPTCLSIS